MYRCYVSKTFTRKEFQLCSILQLQNVLRRTSASNTGNSTIAFCQSVKKTLRIETARSRTQRTTKANEPSPNRCNVICSKELPEIIKLRQPSQTIMSKRGERWLMVADAGQMIICDGWWISAAETLKPRFSLYPIRSKPRPSGNRQLTHPGNAKRGFNKHRRFHAWHFYRSKSTFLMRPLKEEVEKLNVGIARLENWSWRKPAFPARLPWKNWGVDKLKPIIFCTQCLSLFTAVHHGVYTLV